MEHQMVMGDRPELRVSGFDSLQIHLEDVLRSNAVSKFDFDSLRSLAIQYPPDSTFCLITAQCEVDPDHYRHFGFIKTHDTLFVLEDISELINNPEGELIGEWFGALYYNLVPFNGPEGISYLLFGFDGHSKEVRRKLIDVLTFSDQGKPRFGAPVFVYDNQEKKHRVILEYSSEISIKLNYDEELEMVLFDHLIPMKGIYENQPIVMVSDGSYEGFKLENRRWKYVEKVFHQVNDSAPGAGLTNDRKKLFKN